MSILTSSSEICVLFAVKKHILYNMDLLLLPHMAPWDLPLDHSVKYKYIQFYYVYIDV